MGSWARVHLEYLARKVVRDANLNEHPRVNPADEPALLLEIAVLSLDNLLHIHRLGALRRRKACECCE